MASICYPLWLNYVVEQREQLAAVDYSKLNITNTTQFFRWVLFTFFFISLSLFAHIIEISCLIDTCPMSTLWNFSKTLSQYEQDILYSVEKKVLTLVITCIVLADLMWFHQFHNYINVSKHRVTIPCKRSFDFT